MPRPPLPFPAPAHGIAASFGGMLGALLYALLGWLRGCGARDVAGLEGTMAPVLAAQASVDLELEPLIAWEWVPAPWRNGRLLPARHGRGLALPVRSARPPALGRGPPSSNFTSVASRTGMA